MPPAYPIGENGHVSHLKVIRRAALELNGSATTAISQWRYQRTPYCPASKGATETFIDVDYSLLN